MTYGSDPAQAAPAASGWAAPQGGAPKNNTEKWMFWLLLFGYASLHAITSWVITEYVQTAPVEGGVLQLPEARGAFRWIGYASTPFYVLAKVGFTALCLALGAAIISWKVRFSRLFHAAMMAEIVWAAAEVVRLFWMLLTPGMDPFFYPLSLLSLVEVEPGSMWAVHILRTLNLFEAAYVLLLARMIRLSTEQAPQNVTLLAAVSYGGVKALLIAAITFILLSVF